MTDLLEDNRRDAVLSEDGTYRYRLSRTWDAAKPTLAWVMLNPSTADATEDDPTIRRCVGFAEDWGYGSIVVVNLFALRATKPDELRDHPNPVGPENDAYLRDVTHAADRVVAAWGANGSLQGRASQVATMLDADLEALDTTKAGHPNHPLYQPSDAEPEPWSAEALRTDDSYNFPELEYVDRAHLQSLYNLHGRDRVLGWLRGKVAVPPEYKYEDDFDENAFYEAAVDHYVETDGGSE